MTKDQIIARLLILIPFSLAFTGLMVMFMPEAEACIGYEAVEAVINCRGCVCDE